MPIPPTFEARLSMATTQRQRFDAAHGYFQYTLRHHGRVSDPRPESERAAREEACRLAADHLLKLCEALDRKLAEP